MRKTLFLVLVMVLSVSALAQQKIQLRSADRAECVSSDMTSLKALFSFSTIEAEDYSSDQGTFSWLSLPNTVLYGNVGEPQIPVVNELIAVPFGAQPRIEITSYNSTDYNLADYGMKTLMPRQRPVRKSENPDDEPFIINEAAYQSTRGLRSEPQAVVSVEGTMRGIQLGTMTIEPVSYDPVSNKIRVFNDIEVIVHFDGADAQVTEDMLLRTYSPAFEPIYAQLFNGRAITDVYTDHPDLYNTPVRMLVICYSGFKNNSSLNSWLQWKLQKGYYVDIFYTDETGTTANSIKNFIKTKYNASVSAGNAYTYLIVIGDTDQVPQYMTKTIDNTIGQCASDLGYSAVNFTTSSTSNYFPDMYYSRISVENTTHLTNYINKVLTYEKFEFTDGGNYLNNVVLVGGWDSNWTARVAKPTINYATNNYFNSSNTTYGGFSGGTIKATISTGSGSTCNTPGYSGTNHGCYNGINNGVCFLNYTAHGDKQEWQAPQFTAKQVETVTNTGKYFFGVGNCCLTGNYNLNDANYSASYAPSSSIGATASFGETMIRVPNAGAIAYVGCSPYSYWYEDFYWAVGAHSYSAGSAPSVSSSTRGVYDVMFQDQYWNSASALLYLGNLAVQQAVTNGNTTSGISGSGLGGDCNNSAHYYFQFYHTFGDGSIMPYITKPEQNTVSTPSAVSPGTTSITVNALAGSYVAVTDNNSVIYGVAEANSSGMATVNFTNVIPNSGTLHVVVTRQQYQPYFGTIEVVGSGTQYNITTTVNPTGAGTVEGAGQYYENTQCTLTATANHGYAFDNWTLNNVEVSNNPTYVFTVTGDANYMANFHALTQHNITYTAQQTHGTISVSPVNAYVGDIITLTATPETGYVLDQWEVNKASKGNVPVDNNQFTMPDCDVTVSASFKVEERNLTVYDGTATNQYIPMYGFYFDEFTKSECIIPASQLTEMVGGTISAITFYPSSVGTNSTTWEDAIQTVFLKEVENTTLGGSYSGTTGATIVKQALLDMPTAGTEYTIIFDSPYIYSGGNLLIGVYNTTDGEYNKVEWYGTSNLTSGVSAYGNNGSSLASATYKAQAFLPKTKFTYTPTTSPYLTLAPNSATVITGFTQTLTANYGNVSGTPTITYTSSNASVATVSGSGTTATVTGVSAGTATITATMTYESVDYTATCSITVEEPQYCTPSFGSNNDCITNITLGNINNTTASSSTNGYGDYTSLTTDLEAGTTATLSLTSGVGSGTHAAAVWIDFDDSYTFESSERVGTKDNIKQSATVSIDLAIPNNVKTGSHRMRVVYQYNVSATNIDPCASATYGEGEDYTVTIPPFTIGINAWNGAINDGWYMIASPLQGSTPVTSVANLTNNSFDLYRFNQSAELEWENYKQAGNNYHFDLESGRGYLYANSGNVTLTFSGTPYTGNGQVTISNVAGNSFSGWNLIGNPWSKTATIGRDFFKMNDDHDEVITASSPNIAAMEGIFVYTDQSEETVTFSTGGAKANFTNERIVLNLSHNGGKVIDRAIVRFGDGSTLPKFQLRDNSAKLYIPQNGKDYAVVRVNEQGEIPVNFKTYENGQYTLSVGVDDLTLGYLHLIDNLTGSDVDLLTTPNYSFDAKSSNYASRFKLVFAVNEDNLDSDFAFVSNGQIIVNGQGALQVIDVLGRIITNVETSYYGISTKNMVPGVYVLRLINGSDVKTQKIVIE